MRKLIYIASVLMLVGLSTAVVGGPEPGEDEAAITGVQEQGWQASLELVNATCMSNEEEGVDDYGVYTTEPDDEEIMGVHFTGFIQTPNPCYTVDHEVTDEGYGVYTMNVVTESDLEEGEVCMQCVGIIEYQASFETDEGFQLHVEHDGERVETIEHEYDGSNGEDNGDETQGVFSSFFNWLRNLF